MIVTLIILLLLCYLSCILFEDNIDLNDLFPHSKGLKNKITSKWALNNIKRFIYLFCIGPKYRYGEKLTHKKSGHVIQINGYWIPDFKKENSYDHYSYVHSSYDGNFGIGSSGLDCEYISEREK